MVIYALYRYVFFVCVVLIQVESLSVRNIMSMLKTWFMKVTDDAEPAGNITIQQNTRNITT